MTANVAAAVELAGMMRKGLPPVAGGALDQAEQFMEACRAVWAEERYWSRRDRIREIDES